MKGIVITTKDEMRVQEFSKPAHKSIGEAVGGWIEVVRPVRLERPYCMIVNDEGVLLNLPMNMFGSFLYGTDYHGNWILGDIVLLKEGINSDGKRLRKASRSVIASRARRREKTTTDAGVVPVGLTICSMR